MFGASFAEGRADIAANIAQDDVSTDRPGKADPAFETIANLEGRRGNAEFVSSIHLDLDDQVESGNVNHFALEATERDLMMNVGEEYFEMGIPNSSTRVQIKNGATREGRLEGKIRGRFLARKWHDILKVPRRTAVDRNDARRDADNAEAAIHATSGNEKEDMKGNAKTPANQKVFAGGRSHTISLSIFPA